MTRIQSYYYYYYYCLPVVLYGCETWSLTLRKEHRLRVFENRVLRWIFGPKRDEVTGEWRKLHNEEIRDFYSSPSIIRLIKSTMEFFIYFYSVFVFLLLLLFLQRPPAI
jgi:hypothetical protein